MNADLLVNVENVSRYYNGVCAVENISFSMKRAEVLGLLGPNGAGKSTTMKMICGVLAANEGHITVAGHSLDTEAKQARAQTGYLPERPPLYTDLTVDEYLRFCGRLHALHGRELERAMKDAKARCGLDSTGKRLIGNLSRGYQQRVGIAQAIIHSPAVVILDEPTSGLDPNQIVEIRLLIKELGEDHSVILSTHILQEVQSACNRALIIHQGKLVLDSVLADLEQDNHGTNITIGCNNPPVPEDIESLSIVRAVQQLDKNRFRIQLHESETMADIAKIAASNNWELYELIPEQGSLENIFMQLTQ